MRTVYRQLLDTFSHDLILYCDLADKAMTMASTALTKAELQPAEDVLGLSDHAEELRQRCEDRAVDLLALENPMARDLRQVVSSIYIVQDFDRMFKLSCPIAQLARRGSTAPGPPSRWRFCLATTSATPTTASMWPHRWFTWSPASAPRNTSSDARKSRPRRRLQPNSKSSKDASGVKTGNEP